MTRTDVPRRYRLLGAVAIAGLVAVGCGSDDDSSLADTTVDVPDDAAEAASDLAALFEDVGATSLASAVDELDIASLTDSDEFTFLAPDDAAFRSLDADTLADLLADREALTDLLRDHLIPERLTADDLRDRDSVTSELGTTHEIAVDGDIVTVGGVAVTEAGVADGPGLVHLVDGFLA